MFAWSEAQRERLIDLPVTLLQLLNRSGEQIDTIRDVLSAVKDATGIEAVGIRLKENEDYPYYTTFGFPGAFVEAERFLCDYDSDGQIVRDEKFDPALACMCGNVIRGRTDPSLPFFTKNGSFWSNCTTELLAATTEEERQANTRNRCNGEGYESVALIPLRSDHEVIGLLQLNDTRREVFTLELIEFFENLGASIGIALARKQSEEALRASEERLNTLFATMAEGVVFIEPTGVIAYANTAAEELLGLDRPTIEERHYTSAEWEILRGDGTAMPPDEMAGARAMMERRMVTGQVMGVRRPDGSITWISVGASPIIEGSGVLAGVVGTFADITERKRAEEALLRANEELKGYAHTVSHDLKSPLSAVAMAAEMLSSILEGDDGEALEGDAGEVLRIIGDSTRRALGLSDDLLTLAQAGEAPAKREQVDISGVVRSILQENEALLEERGVRVSLDEDLGVASMDPTHVYQVFSNLISNSIKYNDSEDPEIHVSRLGEAGPGRLRYLVRDNGPGVPDGAEENIFLPFHKGEGSTDTGIGLSIVNKVVSSYNGQVRAYNDGGACFEFTLPIYSS